MSDARAPSNPVTSGFGVHELDLVGVEGLGQREHPVLDLPLADGIQIRDRLNWKWSDIDTTVTFTSLPSSCFTLRAAASPAKFPPRTSTFLSALLGQRLMVGT
jgi:hypothetical protein